MDVMTRLKIIGNKLCIAEFAVMQTVKVSLYSVVVKRGMR